MDTAETFDAHIAQAGTESKQMESALLKAKAAAVEYAPTVEQREEVMRLERACLLKKAEILDLEVAREEARRAAALAEEKQKIRIAESRDRWCRERAALEKRLSGLLRHLDKCADGVNEHGSPYYGVEFYNSYHIEDYDKLSEQEKIIASSLLDDKRREIQRWRKEAEKEARRNTKPHVPEWDAWEGY